EGGRVEAPLPLLARVGPRDEPPVLEHGPHARLLEHERLVADELRAAPLEQAHVHGVAGDRAHLRREPSALALGLQMAFETVAVYFQTFVADFLLDQVERKAERVVKAEGFLSGK